MCRDRTAYSGAYDCGSYFCAHTGTYLNACAHTGAYLNACADRCSDPSAYDCGSDV
jgi:hypothetical protein